MVYGGRGTVVLNDALWVVAVSKSWSQYRQKSVQTRGQFISPPPPPLSTHLSLYGFEPLISLSAHFEY